MKILVVDDEKTIVKGIKFNLENEGYQVDVCYDGETAVDMARRGEYAVILLDLVWGYDYQGDIRTVDVHIRRLREKLERNPAAPEYIITKWGVGYYFAEA